MADNNELLEEECEIITLEDEKGNDVDFYHVATIDYKDEWYVFLQPCKELDGIAEDEVLIYKLGADEDGEDTFIPIEDEEELNAVFNEYLKESEECDCEDCGCGDCNCGEENCNCDDDDCKDEKCKCGNCDCDK